MVSMTMLFPTLLAAISSATAAAVEAGLPYSLGKPTFFGSGCPKDTVAVVSSTDGKTISVLFSEFASSTTSTRWRQYKSCSLAVPLDIKPVSRLCFEICFSFAYNAAADSLTGQ
jgi:hypothetical protein